MAYKEPAASPTRLATKFRKQTINSESQAACKVIQ